ncbi:ABC transporter permease [Neorhizobium lilium]|uniref:ABC transporter permease n=1 Tax=Neorhizobium lilium TaxID=2503024 RepID=A0A444LN43_9HYPH|nr:ABC transporter permease [Neorhizobium lilium]RWX81682.1 ABC transporter permease [Neorhizobium lilium]
MSAALSSIGRVLGRPPIGIVLAIATVVVILVAAIFAPLIAPYDPNVQNLLGRLKPPGFVIRNTHYLLGSDELGRDTFSRLIYGARISLLVAFASVVLSGITGSILGMLAALYRGWVETVIMRAVDIVLSIPAILMAIITVATLGPGLQNVVFVLVLTRWPRYARVAYGQTLIIANTSYLRLSRSMGAGWFHILRYHVLPNIAGAIVVVVTLEFGLMVLFEAGLSFLGLGVQPPTASWGVMLSVGRNYVANAWWLSVIPGAALFLFVLSVNVLGDFLRDRLDPRSR